MSNLLRQNTQNKQCKSSLGGCVMKFLPPTLNSLQIFIEDIVISSVHIMSTKVHLTFSSVVDINLATVAHFLLACFSSVVRNGGI